MDVALLGLLRFCLLLSCGLLGVSGLRLGDGPPPSQPDGAAGLGFAEVPPPLPGGELPAPAAPAAAESPPSPPDRATPPEQGAEAPPEQQEAAPHVPKDVRLLRVQKNGGSIFGDVVLKKFCDHPADTCRGSGHEDWSQVTEGGNYSGAVVTLLRDPVERIMSEFFWLRSADGLTSASRADWDFRNQTWLDLVQHDADVERAFDIYLHGYENSPSRNRQTLYLLGFRDPSKGEQAYEVAEPGAAYAWDVEPGKYARWAMENLDKMAVFGITDCWMPSMRAFARKLGWDAEAFEEFAAASTPGYGRHEIDVGAPTRNLDEGASWRRNMSREKIKEIERLNKVDFMVFRRALKRFEERFGEACSLPYEPFGPVMRELQRKQAKV